MIFLFFFVQLDSYIYIYIYQNAINQNIVIDWHLIKLEMPYPCTFQRFPEHVAPQLYEWQ